jgi:hypothetical protein
MTTMIPVYEITTERDNEEYRFLSLTDSYTAMWNLLQYHESFKYMEREVKSGSKAHKKILDGQDTLIQTMMKAVMALHESVELTVIYTSDVDSPVIEPVSENEIEKPIAVIETSISLPATVAISEPVARLPVDDKKDTVLPVSEKPRMQKMPVGKKKPSVSVATPVQVTPLVPTPVQETPVQVTLVQETPVQETPVQETAVQVTPVQVTPVQETPVVPTPVQVTPVQETVEKKETVPSGKGCTTIMVRGPRKGQMCEAPCLKGQTVCRLHAPKSV